MSRPKLIWAAIRALIIIALASLAALNGREWLFNGWNVRISSGAYFWVAGIFMASVVWLANRDILRDLKADAIARLASQFETPISSTTTDTDKNRLGYSFQYPSRLGYLVSLVAAFWFVVPFVSGSSEKPFKLFGYPLFWGAGIVTLSYAIYCFLYKVRVSEISIRIRGFAEHEYDLSNIQKIDVVSTRGGPVAVVTLANGQILRFSGMLKNFSMLVTMLREKLKEKINGDRHH